MEIKVENVTKTYKINKTNAIRAIKGVSLHVSQGEFVGIIGVSGSGKSTLLRIIGTLDLPSSGSIRFNETDITKMKDKQIAEFRNKNIGFVFQDYALIPYKTVEENLEIPLLLSDVDYKAHKSIISEQLKLVNMSGYEKRKVRTLSGGQMQRIAIARGLVRTPSIILADEPTGALDSSSKSEILNLLKQINRQGKTIIVVTHDPHVVKECSKVIKIEDGELVD